jgi:signal transduction histidine kinase/DNA-binding LacI/PurR family transcriptional regulator
MDEETRQNVNGNGRAGKLNRPTIGLFIPDTTEVEHAQVWHGVVDAAQERGANVICFTTGNMALEWDERRQMRYMVLELAGPDTIDGLITFQWWHSRERFERFYERYRPLPVLNATRLYQGYPGIAIDNHQSMYDLVTHFITVHGCSRIAYVPGGWEHQVSQIRYRGYVDALSEHGIPLDPDLVVPFDHVDAGTEAAGANSVPLLLDERHLQPGVDVEAIVAFDDEYALAAMRTLQQRSVQVPDEVAVAGLDDLVHSRLAVPALTTVAMPRYESGWRAAEMLLDLIEGKAVPEQVILPAQFQIRRSCGCMSPAVAQAAAGKTEARVRCASLDDALTTQRAGLLAAIAQAAETAGNDLDWAGTLLDRFVADVRDGSPETFARPMEEMLRGPAGPSNDPTAWQNAISCLRRALLPCLEGEMLARAEDLWQQARVLIGEMCKQIQAQRQWQARQQAKTLSEIGQALITTFDVEGLMDVLVKGLLRLRIASAYLSLYEDPMDPAQWSRLVLAYDQSGRVPLGKGGQRFPSRQLVPEGMLSRERATNLVVEPLYFRERQIGFVLFEPGPRGSEVYETLRTQLSSALEGALLIAELQREIGERAQAEAALEAANQDLESFVYSVSHDLRAPLRAIDGFSRILTLEHGPQIPPQAHSYLDRVRDNARRMGQLIDGLLAFSRLGRQNLRKQYVSPKDLVDQVLPDLLPEQGSHQVAVEVGEMPPCRADPTLLRQVYANLLSNALKFTRGRDGARIYVGSEQRGRQYVYFVRDNGVGFDMRYADKLFGVFQRLHGEEEYEGTGVGLAIVQRIIHRHGGRIWVEAEVGKGATFFFVLEAGGTENGSSQRCSKFCQEVEP